MPDIAEEQRTPVVCLAGWAVAYGLAHALSTWLAIPGQPMPGLWLPIGVAIAAFTRLPHRYWPAAAAVGLIANTVFGWIDGRPAMLAALLTLADVGAGMSAGLLLRTALGPSVPPASLRGASVLLVVVGAVAVVWATVVLAVAPPAAAKGWFETWDLHFNALAIGAIVVAPLLVRRPEIRRALREPAWVAETAILTAIVILLVVASNRLTTTLPGLLLVAHLQIATVLWAAVRRGPMVGMGLMLVSAVMATATTMNGGMLVLSIGETEAMVWLQRFIAAGAIPALLLSASAAERQAAVVLADERASILTSIAATAPDAIITIGVDGVIRAFNPAASRLFGYDAAEVIGRNVDMLMPAYFGERHDSFIARYLRTRERRVLGVDRLLVGERRDGTTFPMELAVGEANVDGRSIFVGFIRDLSEMQRTQRRLQEMQADLLHAARLREIGVMAAGLAHEINQPLAAIANYVEAGRRVAAASERAGGPIADILSKIERQAVRAGEIVRGVRRFVRKHESKQQAETLNGVIEEGVALALIGRAGPRTRLRMALASRLPKVSIDRVQVQQVLVNLIRNAVEATELEGGEIVVASARETDEFVRVSVSDQGPGLAEDIQHSVFEAFVTTKQHGMGIGLSICRTIVEAHGGRIWHEPLPEGGTAFHFLVPVEAHRAEGE
jgi:two-component system sensor kinase FixL